MKTTSQRYLGLLSLHLNLVLLGYVSLLLTLGECWCFETQIVQFTGIASIDFSYDSLTLLALDKLNKKINFWRMDTKQLIKVYPITDTPNTAKFSKTGNYFAFGTVQKDVWIIQSVGYTLAKFVSNPLNQQIVDLDFSWNSNNLAICTTSKFKFIDFTGAGTWSMNGLNGMQSCKLNKADGLGIAHNNQWMKWFLKDQSNQNNPIAKDQIPDCDQVFQVDFSLQLAANQPRLVGTCKKPGKHKIVSLHYGDMDTSRFIRNISNEGKAICYSRDNRYFAAADKDGRFYVVAADGWINDTYHIFQDAPSSIEYCRFSHDGKYLAAGDTSGNIFIYTNNCFPRLCAQGQYDNSGVCASCSIMSYCIDCTSGANCIACSQNYYLQAGSCKSCRAINFCISCESSSSCKQCQQGYYLNSTSCISCDSKIKGCLSCTSNQTNQSCVNCHSQYYLNTTDGICYPCVINDSSCVNCLGPNICLSCAPSYYLFNYSCIQCPNNCKTCSNSTLCLECKKGFYTNQITTYTCKQCNSNCLDCYNDGFCKNCIAGFYSQNGTCTNCTGPCQTCNSNKSCFSCYPGYFLESNSTCTVCRAGCLSCHSSQFCLNCQVGYQMLWNNTCQLCSKNFTKCVTCNQTSCLGCEQGYFLASSNSCTSCNTLLQGCVNCLNSTICTLCNIGFYLNSTSCSPCNDNCESCFNSTFCINCAIGYYFSSNTCNPCTFNCAACTSNNDCQRCIIGYFVNSSAAPRGCLRCNQAIVGCQSCNSSSNCLQCESGRFLTALKACSYCSGNCSICNTTTCLSCNVGFYVNLAGSCIKCSENCSQCSSNLVCSNCNIGFYLNTSVLINNCYSCANRGCLTCNMSGCLSCHIGNFLSSLTCANCNNSFSNCLVCKQLACVQCNYGFFSDSSGKCVSCITNIAGCTSCFNSTTCSECSKGYYLASNSICSVCPTDCLNCENNICTSCRSGYTLNITNTICVLCERFIQGCQFCSANSSCYDCLEGYFLSGSLCLNCKSNILGCLSCSNSTYCLVCQQGYFSSSGVCQSCNQIPSCSFCSNLSNCVSCQSGHYINNLGSCSKCSSSLLGCQSCLNVTTCKQCLSGYYLDLVTVQCIACLTSQQACIRCSNSSSCIECDGGFYLSSLTLTCLPCSQPGCQICHNSLISSCTACTMGYYLSGTQCLNCLQAGCFQCNSTDCLKCTTGYYLSTGLCIGCKNSITACSKCINSTLCLQCDSSFYLTNIFSCQSCNAAIPTCEICFNSTHCTTCKSGYYPLSNGACTSCKNIAGCFMCLNSSYCQSCYNGYYLEANNICIDCSSNITDCYLCNSSSTCYSCKSGFSLDASGKCIQIVVESKSIYDPIPFLQVKIYYMDSTKLKHVLLAKQGYQFTEASINWNSTTTISLFNTALNLPTKLTILSVQWGPRMKSLIYFTNNPLNFNKEQIQMPLYRLLLNQQDLSFQFQTKFQITKDALSILFPNVIFSNGFSQNKPLMQPSLYLSFIQQAGQYQYTVIGYFIVGLLALNTLIKATCTAPSSQNIGDHVPHILALKTCALVVFPIYVEVSNFCYGLMAADIPWFSTYYSAFYLSDPSDTSPIGFQLFYDNMNLASMYLSAIIIITILLLISILNSHPHKAKKQSEIFNLSTEINVQANSLTPFIRLLIIFFSFGLTFAGSSSIQGAFFNSFYQLNLNGFFYILGALTYILMLFITIKLTFSSKQSPYLRSFVKATILSISHISPIYICTLAIIIDVIILIIVFKKSNFNILNPRLWLFNGIICNLALLLLILSGQKKAILYTIITLIFISILCEFYDHYEQVKISKSKSASSSDSGTSQKDMFKEADKNNETINHLLDNPTKEYKHSIIQDNQFDFLKTSYSNATKNTIYSNKESLFNGEIAELKSNQIEEIKPSKKRVRKFHKAHRLNECLKIEPIIQNSSDLIFDCQDDFL